MRLHEIEKHLQGVTEAHVREKVAALPPAETAKLPHDWMQKLRSAGFDWASILALLVQGIPAILAILQQLFPQKQPTP